MEAVRGSTARGHVGQPTGRALGAVIALLLPALIAAGCTTDVDQPDPQPEPVVEAEPADAPEVPVATDPTDLPPVEIVPTAPAPDPRPGDVVLVHLEGPATDPAATDVVIRDDRGLELDRFRLAGATDIHSGPGSSWAVVEAADGVWARYDATTGGLVLLTFDGEAPAGLPQVVGPLAWWDDPQSPWLLRLDTLDAWSLQEQMGEAGSVTAIAPDTSRVLVGGDQVSVVDTADGSARTVPADGAVTMSADGAALVFTAPGIDGVDVYREDIDGAGRTVVATVPAPGLPVPLADRMVAVLGETSSLVQADGTVTELPPAPGASDPLLTADGTRALVTTTAGLAVVDGAAGTVTTIPDTAGYTPYPFGSRDPMWAISDDRVTPGAVVIDPQTGQATRLLEDLPTSGITSITTDGQQVTLQVGATGRGTILASADGTTTPLAVDATLAESVIHPDGGVIATAVVKDETRAVRLGDPGAAAVEFATARSPVWLLTGR